MKFPWSLLRYPLSSLCFEEWFKQETWPACAPIYSVLCAWHFFLLWVSLTCHWNSVFVEYCLYYYNSKECWVYILCDVTFSIVPQTSLTKHKGNFIFSKSISTSEVGRQRQERWREISHPQGNFANVCIQLRLDQVKCHLMDGSNSTTQPPPAASQSVQALAGRKHRKCIWEQSWHWNLGTLTGMLPTQVVSQPLGSTLTHERKLWRISRPWQWNLDQLTEPSQA